ncbi:MAG: 4-(cytidine 5'-diphospho)-2-C-methyl-D-erythritol kinase [Desulfobacterales bacterium]|nr:4-(cytidine 5'-diphospho)-2-C-methyl-D-erythritol kinase [Deltaproteobacteria bacterium]NNK93140.1 4-(cytidine 5'-diphospho)-2-C-methyl-D-erythritol kinase [Desulfobacterales bacterium]
MIEMFAPAKINLSLCVLGKREDGYHDVVTRMQKLDLCDVLTMTRTDRSGITLSSDDYGVPHGNDNLAVKAAQIFLKSLGATRNDGVSLSLKKNIPIAAGLGGGSSDAGAALRGLNNLFGSPYNDDQLIDMARPLGADVPFFASPYTAVQATGIGDRLRPVKDLSEYWYMLVNPGFTVSTRWVFENYRLTTSEKNSTFPGFQNKTASVFDPAMMHNDLEQVTMSRYPIVRQIKDSLLEEGAKAAMMSGSGPTVFGLFEHHTWTEKHKEQLVERYSTLYGNQVYSTCIYAGA